MLRDVFYFNKKPNVHPRERFAESLEDARQQCTTSHFWIINELCDYNAFDWDFDFEFLPDEDVWAEDHNNVWPSQHQKDSGTWLCPREHSDVIIYRSDVDPVKRRNEKHDAWVLLEPIHEFKFDFSWHPDPTSPPYIYRWGCKFFPAELKHFVEYVVPGATEVKYMNTIVELLPEQERWVEHQLIDRDCFDLSWRPDPMDPPFIYVWGNKWVDGKLKPTLEYHAPGATDKKYMPELLKVLPEWDRWEIIEPVDKSTFDFSWRPDPREPDLIYVFGNEQYDGNIMPTIEYRMPDAVDKKYVNELQFKAKLLPDPSKFEHLEDSYGIDYSWRPDPTSPPYIYAWGNQWNAPEDKVSIQYVVEGATEYKYMEERTTRRPNKSNWIIPNGIDDSNFDYSWEPNPNDAPYIYEFCTQWQKTGGPKYIVDGATETKYMNLFSVTKLLPDSNWEIPKNIDVTAFDFSWHPDATSPPYIYVFATQWALSGGPIYRAPGATEFKYIEDQQAIAIPDKTNWEYDPNLIDEASFDFSWHPYEDDDPFVYQFGTQWQKTGGPRYIAPGARSDSAIKYIDVRILKAIRLPSKDNWKILNDYLIADFDFSWHPDETEEPFIYVFGNTRYSAEEMPTIEYRVPGATQVKHVNDTVARLGVDMRCWQIPDNVDVTSFDFSWQPHPKDSPYIYQFGTQWQKTNGPRYVVEGATEVKYVSGSLAVMKPNRSSSNWAVVDENAIVDFDYSWHPDETEEPYIYQFGTQWQKTGGPRYIVEGATEIKYTENPVAKRATSKNNWEIPESFDCSVFDFSWHPDETADPAIYQFGSVVGKDDGPRYVVPGNNKNVLFLQNIELTEDMSIPDSNEIPKYFIETTLEDLINNRPGEIFWAINKDLDYTNFDFDWRPDLYQSNYIHAFGSKENIDTQTYFVNSVIWDRGFKNINYVETDSITVKANLDMFYVDRGNPEARERFAVLKEQFPKIQKTRYLNSWVDTITRCTNRATSNLIWVLNSELDYSNFDFDYYPNPWQMKMVHVFGTQWSHWGTTFMVNREQFPIDTKYIKIVEHLSNLNFVKTKRAKATQCIYDVVVIDHGNPELDNVVKQITEKSNGKQVSTIKYDTSYLNTLRKIIKKQHEHKEHYLWLCSSVCDYSNFDFSYICDPFSKDQLHVFPSERQKFGDTFFVDVNKARELLDSMEVLADFHKVNYNSSMRVARLPAPEIVTSQDSLVDAIGQITNWPYAILTTEDNKNIDAVDVEPMSLWSLDSKNITITSTGATRIIAPREAKDHVKKELYDYPHIKKSARLAMSQPLDIVFLSNGEIGAEQNYEHLLNITKGLKNRVVRIDGVNGRVAAYHAAAEASNTPWAFTVFAKLKISAKFDWNWQPDRMQVPKHYIFQAKNPVNGLIYGHQAMIAYNKKLVLSNLGKGLDFTLDDEHEVVERMSGTAMYNTDAFSTWRTAFREVLKLRAEDTTDAKERLDVWLNKATGDFAEYSIKGALDADEYYDDVNGDFEKLKLSYEWDWLKKFFEKS